MADKEREWTEATGGAPLLSAEDAPAVQRYLQEINFLIPGERLADLAPAGEGNMNVTLRVTTTRRCFILKQSRPWVARYPDIPAPPERVLIERDFQRAILRDHFLTGHMPELLRADPRAFVLLYEDLDPDGDLTEAYADDGGFTRRQLAALLRYAGQLHGLRVTDFPENRAMRTLNHAHVFDLPFRPDNGFPLEAIYPGLARVARPLQHDRRLRGAVAELGQLYLSAGPCLIHGDYHPGSFLEANHRVYVIDTEFAHLGRPEFDLGVLMAHLLLSRASEKRILQIETDYARPPGFDVGLMRGFCCVEIIRRLIGIAQLPLPIGLDERRDLLERASAELR